MHEFETALISSPVPYLILDQGQNYASQQAQYIDSIVGKCWVSVVDDGPYWFNNGSKSSWFTTLSANLHYIVGVFAIFIDCLKSQEQLCMTLSSTLF